MDDANLYLNFSLRKSICPTSLLLSVAATEKNQSLQILTHLAKGQKVLVNEDYIVILVPKSVISEKKFARSLCTTMALALLWVTGLR